MLRRNGIFISILIVVLATEISTLFFMKPHNFTFNAVLSVVFLFISGILLYDFTYKRYLRTMTGIFLYGFTAVVSLVFSEAITLMYVSYLYPTSFGDKAYSNATALGNALILITGYGYPKVTGWAHGIIVFLMLYSWLVNILLISKLIGLLRQRMSH